MNFHPLLSRGIYQTISSGRFAIHMMMSWENAMYAQSMRNMKRKLPRSRRIGPGSRGSSRAEASENRRLRIENAIAERPWPTMKARPKIDEYHFGVSDMTQSIDAKNVVAP